MKTKPIIWDKRYSDTMEDDEQGRWARVAHVGNNNIWEKGRIANFEIAWIRKVNENSFGLTGFVVKTEFPFKGNLVHETLEEAMTAVEDSFEWFIKSVTE